MLFRELKVGSLAGYLNQNPILFTAGEVDGCFLRMDLILISHIMIYHLPALNNEKQKAKRLNLTRFTEFY